MIVSVGLNGRVRSQKPVDLLVAVVRKVFADEQAKLWREIAKRDKLIVAAFGALDNAIEDIRSWQETATELTPSDRRALRTVERVYDRLQEHLRKEER